ncbi:MAG: response regulator transcription factor [Candidatus Phosphoribacter sp.]
MDPSSGSPQRAEEREEITVGAAKPIEVLLVEDHPVVIWGLQSLVLHQPDIRIIGEAYTTTDAMVAATTLQPDIIMLPLRLGGVYNGIELCRALTSVSKAQLLLYTAFAADTDQEEALLAGAAALVPKTATAQDLVQTIRAVAGGQAGPAARAPELRLQTLARESTESLTAREQEILQLVLQRRTNPEIARELVVEVSTVKSHMRSLLRKLGIQSRRDLFGQAADHWS